MKRTIVLVAALLLAASPAARAQSAACREIQVQLQPAAHLQMAVWIEDPQGHFIDTAYVTRSTGALGLANRPGNSRFKSGYRWPYGRRIMVLPVWAHARGKTYPYVVMGGAHGTDPNDDSIGYHESYSSPEAFYCPPSNETIDAMSCASQFIGSKGVFKPGMLSYYPPRADLRTFTGFDSADAMTYASLNDLAAISGATPTGGQVVDPPLSWLAPTSFTDGDYVVKVEASLEGDFNDANRHPTFTDDHLELSDIGYDAMGQPSVVYAVPITVDGQLRTAISDDYIGYGDWDGATGTMHPADGSINESGGSGADRLAHVSDADGTWRVKVTASPCASCRMPAPPTSMQATATDTSVSLDFIAPASIDQYDRARRYEIRYQANVPLTDDSFANGIPADMPPAPGAPGTAQQATLTGLKAQTAYFIGIRSRNACGQASVGTYTSVQTQAPKFTVLHGCFVATAAYGSAMQPDVALLRRFRDGVLFHSPLGRLAVASYYAMSPPVARAIAADDRLRAAARHALEPAVALARAWDSYEHRAR